MNLAFAEEVGVVQTIRTTAACWPGTNAGHVLAGAEDGNHSVDIAGARMIEQLLQHIR